MPRVKNITKAGKSKKTRKCTICGDEIEVGEPYKFIAKRTGPVGGYRLIFCKDHNPRQSHFLSGRAAALAEIGENFQDSIKSLDRDLPESLSDLYSALNEAADDVDSLAEDISNSAQSIEDGFGHGTTQSGAMVDTASELSEWATKIRDKADEIDDDDEDNTPSDHFNYADSIMGEEPDMDVTG